MWPQIVSSLAAAIFLALASFMQGEPFPIVLLAVASVCAWVSHMDDLWLSVRQATFCFGLGTAAAAFFLVLIH